MNLSSASSAELRDASRVGFARANAAGARVITDDNMVPEWRQVLRFHNPPD